MGDEAGAERRASDTQATAVAFAPSGRNRLEERMQSKKTDKTDKTTGEPGDALLHPIGHIADEARKSTRSWWLFVLFGLAAMALGVTALASRIDAVATLVAVFAASLIFAGMAELAFTTTIADHKWPGVLAGVASIAAGFIALAWPGVTLVVLAVLIGVSLITWGVYRIYLSFVDPYIRPRAVTLIEGILLVALGVLALAWPNVSLLVLAVLVGVFFIVLGIFSFVGGLHMLDLHHTLKKAEAEAEEALKDESDASNRDSHRHAA
jgi:uncharacterized membrane protein (DUF106 family)